MDIRYVHVNLQLLRFGASDEMSDASNRLRLMGHLADVVKETIWKVRPGLVDEATLMDLTVKIMGWIDGRSLSRLDDQVVDAILAPDDVNNNLFGPAVNADDHRNKVAKMILSRPQKSIWSLMVGGADWMDLVRDPGWLPSVRSIEIYVWDEIRVLLREWALVSRRTGWNELPMGATTMIPADTFAREGVVEKALAFLDAPRGIVGSALPPADLGVLIHRALLNVLVERLSRIGSQGYDELAGG